MVGTFDGFDPEAALTIRHNSQISEVLGDFGGRERGSRGRGEQGQESARKELVMSKVNTSQQTTAASSQPGKMIKDPQQLSTAHGNPLEEQPPSFQEATAGGSNARLVSSSSTNPAGPSSSVPRSQPDLSRTHASPSDIFEIDGPPPEFSNWDAESSTTSSGDIVSRSTIRIWLCFPQCTPLMHTCHRLYSPVLARCPPE